MIESVSSQFFVHVQWLLVDGGSFVCTHMTCEIHLRSENQ